MSKGELLVPCYFFSKKYCTERCANFFDNLVVTAEVAAEADVSFDKVVEEIVNESNAETSSYLMRLKHPLTASNCKHLTS